MHASYSNFFYKANDLFYNQKYFLAWLDLKQEFDRTFHIPYDKGSRGNLP